MPHRDPDLELLPPALALRTRARSTALGGGAGVLYWMRLALRTEENPALAVAATQAAARGLPLLVYWGLSERTPYANDRQHTFLLQAAVEVQTALRQRGIPALFHLERPGSRGRLLYDLARRASLVVTEEAPLFPLRGWTDRLCAVARVWTVDTANVVPLARLGGGIDRAFRFREQTAAARAEHLSAPPIPEVSGTFSPWRDVPAGDDLSQRPIREWVAACDIDHGVPPVPDTPGGGQAGWARWAAFRDKGLRRYARDRTDPLRPGAGSRLSAYLHTGQISPVRLAREAAAEGTAAEKFLDELLIWREMAFAWCAHQRDPEAYTSLPAWARTSLQDHARDPRERLPPEAELAAGRSGDPVFDLAQTSLLRWGELHNNLRMTWGKALLAMSPDPATAWRRLLDFNHRYALDGRDPSSVGGLGWCLGLFDRPFQPEVEVFGTVRPRSSADHARRLDLGALRAQVTRSPPAGQVLVVGAGVAGAACARLLADHGQGVQVVDKGRGPGGRMSTRRDPLGEIDHGAPWFSARSPEFQAQVRSWVEAGLAARQPEGLLDLTAPPARGVDAPRAPAVERWGGRASQSALVGDLLAGLSLRTQTRVVGLEGGPGAWCARTEEGQLLGPFRAVVLTAPAPQSRALLGDHAPRLSEALAQVRYLPCWVVLAWLEPTGTPVLGFRGRSPLLSAVRHDRRPGRGPGERWTLYGDAAFSEAELESEPAAVVERLLAALSEALGRPVHPKQASAHRWRMARPEAPLGLACLAQDGLVVAGDALLGGRVEAAWRSGRAAAGHLLTDPRPPAGNLPLFGGTPTTSPRGDR